jgi:hypothetical protein
MALGVRPAASQNREKMLRADSEAALCEAGVRRRLVLSGVSVEPNESLTGKCGGPDFRCTCGQDHFYVEVTCMLIATAEQVSGIKLGQTGSFSPNVWGMAEEVFDKCQKKATQCANLDGPALVAVGTFHTDAALFGFTKVQLSGMLTGQTKLAWTIDTESGQQIGDTHQTTELESAAFLMKLDSTQEVGFARNSISGLLLCGLGSRPVRCLGVLHPDPARPFDPAFLRDVEFGEVEVDRPSGQLRVRWTGGGED